MFNSFLGKLVLASFTVFLGACFFTSPAFAETYPDVVFGVGVNNYPDHNNSSLSVNLTNAYVNVYEIVPDSTLGYYKGILKETLSTGTTAASVTVGYGVMVNFIGFKNYSDAVSSTFSEWHFKTPPYKNFGTDGNKLCQTNYFNFNNYLNNNPDYACATSLSTAYKDPSTVFQTIEATTIFSPIENQVLSNFPRNAYINWKVVDNATQYELEVACDYCVSSTTKWLNPTTYFTSNGYYKTPALPGDNEYRTRVRGVNSTTTGPWSSYIYFSFKTDSSFHQTIDATSIFSPKSNQVFSNFPRIAYIDWTEVKNATQYELEVACDYCVSSTTKWLNPTTYYTSNGYYNTPTLPGDNKYRVRVRGVNSVITGPWSSYIYFSFKTDSTTNIKTLPPAGYEDEVISSFNNYNNPFPDTTLKNLEGKAAAELYRRGVIGGYTDGEFKGYRDVNRAELAKFLLLARYGFVNELSNNQQFSDVLEGQWYVKFVVTAYQKGIINGYPDGTFRPGNTVNIAEFLKMLTLTFNLQTGLNHSFTDVSSSAWYDQYAGVAEKYKLFPNKTTVLSPGSLMSRNEVAVAIYQFLLNR